MGDFYPLLYGYLCFASFVFILQRECRSLIIHTKIQSPPSSERKSFTFILLPWETKLVLLSAGDTIQQGLSSIPQAPGVPRASYWANLTWSTITWSWSQGTRTPWQSCRQGDGNCILDGSDGTICPGCSPSRSQYPWFLPGEENKR